MWLCGHVAMWLCGYVAMCPCSYVAMCLCSCAAMWLCGYVALSLCGCVAMRLCVYVAMWLYRYIAIWTRIGYKSSVSEQTNKQTKVCNVDSAVILISLSEYLWSLLLSRLTAQAPPKCSTNGFAAKTVKLVGRVAAATPF